MNNVTILNNRAFWAMLIFSVTAMAVVGLLDSVIPAAHDTFHEVRHALGIPCH
jgi:hypothetical protein